MLTQQTQRLMALHAAWLASKLQTAYNMLNKLSHAYLLPVICTCWFKILKQDRQEQQCSI